MRSPICHLEASIAGVSFAIVPEREKELAELRDRLGLELHLIDDSGFNIRIDVETGTISLPIAALEYLWACAFGYWVITQEYASAQRSGATQFDLRGSKRLRGADSLLAWSLENIQADGLGSWPMDLPAPESKPEHASDVHVANELFLCALAWIVHHEIAHAALGHPSLITSIAKSEEKDADLEASVWILGGLDSDDPHLKKRALGIAIAILCLQSLEVGLKKSTGTIHPDAHERLHYCLQPFKIGDEEVIEAFAVVVLQVLFLDQGISANVDGDSFQSILSEFLVDISRQ